MARLCVVCSHPDKDAIHTQLRAHSTPVAQLATQTGLTRDSLNFCRRAHLAASVPRPHAKPQSAAARRTGTSERARERFLKVYAQCGTVSTAAKAAGVGRATVYVWAEHDESFALAMRQAEISATEVLEQEAWRRARDGFAEPVYQHGKLVGTVQRYSDALLVFLLKARAPERYRDRVDVSVTPVIKAVAGFDPASVV